MSDEVNVHHLQSQGAVARWRPGFIGAYQTVFADPPYEERLYPSEADAIYQQLTRAPDHITLIAAHGSKVVGFAIAVPVRYKKPVARSLAGLVPLYHTMYLAELGVLESYRRQGLGGRLIQRRFALIDRDRYSHVVTRVPASRSVAFERYQGLGMEDMGVYMEVASRRVSGAIRTDRRLILHGVLSQLTLD